MISTFMVATASDLVYQLDEVQIVVNLLKPTLLQGVGVSVQRFQEYLDASNAELLWISGHGDTTGFELSDGILLYRMLVPMLREHPTLKYVYINTCESRKTAESVCDGTGLDVISTIAPVEDRTAYLTGSRLAKHISRGETFFRSYQLSKPAENDEYVFIHGSRHYALSQGKSMSIPTSGLDDKVRDLGYAVYGRRDPYMQTGLIDEMKEVKSNQTLLTKGLDQMRVMLAIIALFLAGILAVLVGLVVTLPF